MYYTHTHDTHETHADTVTHRETDTDTHACAHTNT